MGGVIAWSRARAVEGPPPGIDLSPIVHILLITDGTITPLLEACTGEPMQAVRLSQTVEPCGPCDPQLELDPRQPVLRRTVLIQGRQSGIDYLYAESVIALERISARLRDELLLTDHPIGTVLRDHRVETFKEVLVSGHEPAGPSAAHFAVDRMQPLPSRTFRLLCAKHPIMRVTEWFSPHVFGHGAEALEAPRRRRPAPGPRAAVVDGRA
jgi:chorismate-pyruvate lyase